MAHHEVIRQRVLAFKIYWLLLKIIIYPTENVGNRLSRMQKI